MFSDQIALAIAAAPTQSLDRLSAEVWRAVGSGALSDASASAALEAINAKRTSQGPSTHTYKVPPRAS
jgi:hypothetical protein